MDEMPWHPRLARLGGDSPCVWHEFTICSACFGLRGRCQLWRQRCTCERDSAVIEADWPGHDFNLCLELCRCCAAVPLRSGSKWSVWFCGSCKRRVRRLNQALGFALIPIGRHSVMNGVELSGEQTQDVELVRSFCSRIGGLFERMNFLEELGRERVQLNLRSLGFPAGKDVALDAYVEAALRRPLRKREAFAWLAGRYGAFTVNGKEGNGDRVDQ